MHLSYSLRLRSTPRPPILNEMVPLPVIQWHNSSTLVPSQPHPPITPSMANTTKPIGLSASSSSHQSYIDPNVVFGILTLILTCISILIGYLQLRSMHLLSTPTDPGSIRPQRESRYFFYPFYPYLFEIDS
jgi:hypothetical protein